MSKYLKMWDAIRLMTSEERKNWIKLVTPATGETIEFKGMDVFDVDLLEALTLDDVE